MRFVQAGILAALVLIAGLLFNISSKIGQPAPVATAIQPVAATPAALPAEPVATAPAPAAVQPRTVTRRADPPRSVVTSNPAPVTQSAQSSYPPPPPPPAPASSDTIARPRTSEPDYSGPSYPNSVIAPQGNYPPPPPPGGSYPASTSGAARSVTVPSGTPFTVRMLDSISSDKNRAGDTFQASLDEDLQADGVIVARRGSVVHGKIVQARQAGRVSGVAEMALEIERIQTVAGEMPIASDVLQKEGPTSRGSDAAKVGVLAGIGAAIGAVAGGRKGAGIGAGAGATAGTAGVLIDRGKPVQYNPEDRVTFRLRAPLTVTGDPSRISSSASDPDRPALRRRSN